MNIILVNRSIAIPDADVAAILRDVQAWVDEDLGPAWMLPKTTLMRPGADGAISQLSTPLYILDRSDLAGAVGYHEDVNGIIDGKVFADDAIADGVSWTVDLTHELGEMLCDPTANLTARLLDNRYVAQEVCDPVEADADAYRKGDTLVANFVLPSYFTGAAPPWDFKGVLKGPAPALSPGGYISIWDGQKWSQTFARLADGRMSDRARRRVSRTEWRAAHR